MKKETIILIFLILVLFVLNYNFLDSKVIEFFVGGDVCFVDRVVDGDTIRSGDRSIRLLGINTPEKGEEFSSEAKEFLEEKVLNKSIELVYGKDKIDKYGRTLAYVFVEGENVNLEIVKRGFGNFYFPSGRDNLYDSFYSAWKNCEDNLCEKSFDICAECIQLKGLDYENEKVFLENVCDFDCDLSDWTIKDEGRKNFVFSDFVLKKNSKVCVWSFEGEDNSTDLFWNREDYVWTDSGDTIFLRDSENDLVFWWNY